MIIFFGRESQSNNLYLPPLLAAGGYIQAVIVSKKKPSKNPQETCARVASPYPKSVTEASWHAAAAAPRTAPLAPRPTHPGTKR